CSAAARSPASPQKPRSLVFSITFGARSRAKKPALTPFASHAKWSGLSAATPNISDRLALPSFVRGLTSGFAFSATPPLATCFSASFLTTVPICPSARQELKPFHFLPIFERMASRTPQNPYDLVCPTSESRFAGQLGVRGGGARPSQKTPHGHPQPRAAHSA